MEEEEREDSPDDEGLRSYEIDKDTVRVNNPDPDEPDSILRRLADGEVREYKARKHKD